MPVLALGGENSYGAGDADRTRFGGGRMWTAALCRFGHWIMEENPDATMKLVMSFLAK